MFDRPYNRGVSNTSNWGIQDDLSDSQYHKRTVLRNGDGRGNRRSAGPDQHFPDVYTNGCFGLVTFSVPEEPPHVLYCRRRRNRHCPAGPAPSARLPAFPRWRHLLVPDGPGGRFPSSDGNTPLVRVVAGRALMTCWIKCNHLESVVKTGYVRRVFSGEFSFQPLPKVPYQVWGRG